MAQKRRRSKPLPERGSKQQRRDAEIADTADKAYADSRTRRDCYKSKENDWQWYAQSPELIRDYASYPFGRPVGSKINLGSVPNGEAGTSSINSQSIPGFMVYYYQPTIGDPHDANAPINIAARNIYSYVRHANSGHSNYDAPDLMLYLLAMDSIYMYHSFLKRIVGLLYDYSTLNRYYPRALVQAMGVDFDDLSHHIADLRGFVNQYAVKMGSMCVPNSMSYMARHVWMTEGLYTDGTSSKSQTYMYVPSAYFKFGLDDDGKGQLTSVEFSSPYLNNVTTFLKKFADLVTFGNNLLDPITSNEDLNIMSGDILKAFGDMGVVKVSGVPDGYMVLPAYNQEVLSQMENCTVLGYMGSAIKQNVDVGGGYIYITNAGVNIAIPADSKFSSTSGTVTADLGNSLLQGVMCNKVLNFHHTGVTPEEVMVATRLSNIVAPISTSATIIGSAGTAQITCNVPTMGSEIVTAAIAYQYVWKNQVLSLVGHSMPTANVYPVPSSTNNWVLQEYFNRMGILSTFDWHHQVVPVIGTTDTSGIYQDVWGMGIPIQDVDNYTVIDPENLKNMALTALLSEFSVPQMGAFSAKLT